MSLIREEVMLVGIDAEIVVFRIRLAKNPACFLASYGPEHERLSSSSSSSVCLRVSGHAHKAHCLDRRGRYSKQDV